MNTANTVTRVKIFKDDRLDIDHIDHYSLSFFISSSSIQVSVFDEKRKRLLLYEKYTLNGQNALEALQEIHDDHTLISAGFWQTVRVNIDSHQFSVVPSELFSFEHQFDYVKLNSHTDPNTESYRSVTFDPFNIAFVFAIEKVLIKWFSDKYFNLEVRHSHIGMNFIKFCQSQLSRKEDHRVFIHLGDQEMVLAGTSEGKLSIYNQFLINTSEHLIKFILLSIRQFSQVGQNANISLWGSESQIQKFRPTLNKYFKNLTLGNRPRLKLGPAFSELETYEIIDVLSVHV